MKTKTIGSGLFALFIFLQIFPVFAQPLENTSWNQFRGPDRNGIISENSLPETLPDGGPELIWKKDIGAGFSEITVEGDRIYTMFSEKADSTTGLEYLAAYSAETGEQIWKTMVDSLFFDQFGDGPRSTPAIGDEHIYSYSSYGKLSANSKNDGALVWQVNILESFNSTLPRWGFSSSPVLIENSVVVEAGGTESRGFMGFDKKSGAVIWANGNGMAGYSSPIIARIDGRSQLIFANQTTLFSFDSKGDTLWTFPMKMNSPMATPVFFDGNKIFVSTVRSDGFIVVEVKNNTVTEILNAGTMKNDFSSSLYYEGYIYGFNVAALQCVSAETGEKKWTKRGLGKGTLILVGDKLLALSDKGKLLQIKATPEAYSEQGFFQALDGKSWTAPSFSEGKLYVRNLTQMACYRYQ